jgi:hypothetical protein
MPDVIGGEIELLMVGGRRRCEASPLPYPKDTAVIGSYTRRTSHRFWNFDAGHAFFNKAMPPNQSLEADMPIILWLLGVPLVVVVLLMLTHVI